MKRALTALLTAAVLTVPLAATTTAADASARPAKYKNCTALNKVYKHGVGKAGARDRTSGRPVTTFKRSTKIYKQAMSWNRSLDRDKDGIACEKR